MSEYIIALSRGPRTAFNRVFGTCVGYPGVEPSARLLDYIERYRYDPLYTYGAYAGATLKDVRAALAFRPAHADLVAAQRTGDPRRFLASVRAAARVLQYGAVPATDVPARQLARATFRRMAARVGTRVAEIVLGRAPDTRHATTFTSLVPVADGADHLLRAELADLAARAPAAFDDVPRVHFARFAVVDRIYDSDNVRDALDRPHLLFSAQFNGSADALVAQLAACAPEIARVWRHCDGYEGADATALGRFLHASHVPDGLYVAAIGDLTVAEVRAALADRERAQRLVDALSEPGPPDGAALLRRFRADAGIDVGGRPAPVDPPREDR